MLGVDPAPPTMTGLDGPGAPELPTGYTDIPLRKALDRTAQDQRPPAFVLPTAHRLVGELAVTPKSVPAILGTAAGSRPSAPVSESRPASAGAPATMTSIVRSVAMVSLTGREVIATVRIGSTSLSSADREHMSLIAGPSLAMDNAERTICSTPVAHSSP